MLALGRVRNPSWRKCHTKEESHIYLLNLEFCLVVDLIHNDVSNISDCINSDCSNKPFCKIEKNVSGE